ncbi:MAG: class I mannose-6-phosphate isomerase [Verrucomicrobia bacterium]|nr:class I mannose-6-phosphate isomerase [Verrucomicrobiota bacterium]
MLYPFIFHPIFKERVWGGRNIERLYGKALPTGHPIGESWEMTDRTEGVSVIANGPLAGKTLRWLMEDHRQAVLGKEAAVAGPFPVLIKILDAQETLSVQVHPPAAVAKQLGGEPKTEMWFITDATPTASLFAGLKGDATRADFEQRLVTGTVAEALHQIPTKAGDCMFLPSGRLHAIGAGNVLFEIQQNSDTTYRVFDWNRVGLDGKPRELHLPQSLASINFDDFEPELIPNKYSRNEVFSVRYLVDHPLFRVDACQVKRGKRFYLSSDSVQIVGIVRGTLTASYGDTSLTLKPGDFCLLPACLGRTALTAGTQTEFLHIQPSVT